MARDTHKASTQKPGGDQRHPIKQDGQNRTPVKALMEYGCGREYERNGSQPQHSLKAPGESKAINKLFDASGRPDPLASYKPVKETRREKSGKIGKRG